MSLVCVIITSSSSDFTATAAQITPSVTDANLRVVQLNPESLSVSPNRHASAIQLESAINLATSNESVLILHPHYLSLITPEKLVASAREALALTTDLIYLHYHTNLCESSQVLTTSTVLPNLQILRLASPHGIGALVIKATSKSLVLNLISLSPYTTTTNVSASNSLNAAIRNSRCSAVGFSANLLDFDTRYALTAHEYARTQRCVIPTSDSGRPKSRSPGLRFFWFVLIAIAAMSLGWVVIKLFPTIPRL